MQLLLAGVVLVAVFAVATDGQFYSRGGQPIQYPSSYGVVSPYDNYLSSASPYEDEEYQIRVKPIQLHLAYVRQGRGKKGKGHGGGGGWGKGGWWYYRDHKGCHSGTFGPPPGKGLEREHYLQGACGYLGSHWKRQKGGHGGGGQGGGGQGGGGYGGGQGGGGGGYGGNRGGGGGGFGGFGYQQNSVIKGWQYRPHGHGGGGGGGGGKFGGGGLNYGGGQGYGGGFGYGR